MARKPKSKKAVKKEWTEARKKAFVISALRGARWPQKFECINNAYIKDGINPKTGRKCKLHKCQECGELFPKSHIQADHIEPVVGEEGFQGWETYINRMFCPVDGFQALCKECHADKTLMERLKISKEEVPAHRKIISFKKMNAAKQIKLLSQLKIDGGTNQVERVKAYKQIILNEIHRKPHTRNKSI